MYVHVVCMCSMKVLQLSFHCAALDTLIFIHSLFNSDLFLCYSCCFLKQYVGVLPTGTFMVLYFSRAHIPLSLIRHQITLNH